MAEKNKALTPFEKEVASITKEVSDYKHSAEGNVIGIVYKNPTTLLNTNLEPKEFSNNAWRVYFVIASDLVRNQNKMSLDYSTVGFYLEQHPKLEKAYKEYGAFGTIEAVMEHADDKNLDGYIGEIRKWNSVLRLAGEGLISKERLSDYKDMTAEEIYSELETILNNTFANIDQNIKSYNVCDGINELIDNMNEGSKIGMELYGAKMLTNEIAGINKGNIYGLGAASGVGKSTLSFNYLVPSAIKYKRPVVFIINEEDQEKMRTEMLVWVVNNVIAKNESEQVQKYVVRNGNFNDKTMKILRKAAEWIEGQKDERLIMVIPLERYSVNTVIKIINQYASINPETIFCLDTLKESFDAKTDEVYKSMMRDMIALYDTIKPSNKNVPLFVTYQLGKSSIKLRHLTNAEIGQARSIVDVMSVNLMCRKPYDDEYEGGTKEIYCYRFDNDGFVEKLKKNEKQYKLKREDQPMITFIAKNRFGVTDQYQVVSSCDFGRNICKDIAYCRVPQDY